MTQLILFDYQQLDTEARIVIQQRTNEIKVIMRRAAQDIVEIGEKLIDVKERLEHGQFGAWLEAEFGWSDRTARRYMMVAEHFKSDTVSDLNIQAKALYLLASSTSDEVRQEAIERAQSGEKITYTEAKKIVAQHEIDQAPAFVQRAIKVNPALFRHVKNGELSIPEAKKLSRLPEPVQARIVDKITTGQAKTVKEAHRQIKDQEITQRMATPIITKVKNCKIIIGDARQMDLDLFERYGVIIVDPPWPYDNPKDYDPRMGGYTYQPMTLSEIKAIPIPSLAAEDCILFLWGTWPKVPQVVDTMRTWGFEHITGFPWVKTSQSGGPLYRTGHWVAGCSDYVLIGRRGKVSPPSTDNYLGLVGPAFEHSRKPDDVHDLAEELPGPYLELFARRARPDWTVFGNDIQQED